jgi:hypothetical protein
MKILSYRFYKDKELVAHRYFPRDKTALCFAARNQYDFIERRYLHKKEVWCQPFFLIEYGK